MQSENNKDVSNKGRTLKYIDVTLFLTCLFFVFLICSIVFTSFGWMLNLMIASVTSAIIYPSYLATIYI